MKLIKKIAAIMFAFMMVFSLSTNAKAQTDTNGQYAQNDGKIVIDNAVKGNTYTIYRLLKLESYSDTSYSYTLEDGWNGFIQDTGSKYLNSDDNGYITIEPEADMRSFAKEALAYAKKTTLATDATRTIDATSNEITFDKLPLGYYVVGSTVGSLCELNTTDKVVRIQDKNELPTVDKKIVEINKDGTENLVKNNSVNIGDPVEFELTIDVKPGAKNYIVHDKMDSHLQFMNYITYIKANSGENLTVSGENPDYVLKTTDLNDGCTFEISFTDHFYNTYRDKIDNKQLNKITVKYGAVVLDTAPVKVPMKNTVHLTFGDNNTKSEEKETTTQTFGIPVFKYTGVDTPLPGAEFILTTDENDEKTALKFTEKNGKYRFDENNGTTTLVSSDEGKINIEGIKAGTYYLKETKAPKGYNLLKAPKRVEIAEDGSIKVDDITVGRVDVKNNSGGLLPSTGGMGTTLIYLIGGALVLGSGFVLANKKRAKAK